MNTITLNSKLIEKFMNRGIGINSLQCRLLGLTQLKRGWKKSLVGKEIPLDTYQKLLELKGGKIRKPKSPPQKSNLKNYYASLYAKPEWKETKRVILDRDRSKCIRCGYEYSLGVYNVYYYSELKLPWDYPLEAYITLCSYCGKDHKPEYR